MRVIIVGVGKVGRAICQDLAEDGNDIVLIEERESILNNLVNVMDVTGIVGNGADYDSLLQADVQHCDVFIAVTHQDEINIISCILAKKMGAKFTIARVRDLEYAGHQEFMRSTVGIDVLINPERESAKYIMNLLRFPSAANVESFARGRVNIVEYTLPKGHSFCGMSLKDFQARVAGHLLVCIVERNGHVIIPFGDFVLTEGDILHLTGSNEHLIEFFNKETAIKQKIQSVMLIGAGRLTHYLLEQLEKEKLCKYMKVLENRAEAAEKLAILHPSVPISLADGSVHEVLLEEGMPHYDALVALTGIDEENILIAIFANKMGVAKSIAKVNRTQLLGILETGALQSFITPKNIIADIILRLVRSVADVRGTNVEELYRMAHNQVESLEFYVDENAKIVNQRISEMSLRDNLVIAAIVRGKKVISPNGQDMLQKGDHLVVVTTEHSLRGIDDILK